MKLGVISSVFLPLDFDASLERTRDIGFTHIEIPSAGFQRDRRYCDPEKLSADADARARWCASIESHGLTVSALSLHGQPLTPDPAQKARYLEEFRAACRLASQVGLTQLSLLAGVPEGAEGDRTACWVNSAFPPENLAILEWQWAHRVVPYWREQAHYAREHGVTLCFEMHGGDVVYNPQTMLRLHEEVGLGDTVACNFDTSHLIWQGIDVVDAIRRLGPMIRNVHAKDVAIDPSQVRRDGILKVAPPSNPGERPWNARTVGSGNSNLFWRRIVSALIDVGYDDVITIEQDDAYVDPEKGMRQAVALLTEMLPDRPTQPQRRG